MNKQKGLSLVELMIAITLGLVLMAGVVQMFLSSRAVFSNNVGLSRNQETGRLAIEFMSRDIRNAGYYGCFKPNPSLKTKVTVTASALGVKSGLYTDFDVPIVGYANVSKLPNGALKDLGNASAKTNSSILVVRSGGVTAALINTLSGKTSLDAYTQGLDTGSCVGELCKNTALVAANCSRAIIFAASNLALTKNLITITHDDDWNGKTLNDGAVLPVNTVVYFLAPGTGGNTSLFQRVNIDPPVELLEGVEDMDIKFLDKSGGYVGATSVTDWSSVRSAKVELLVRSIEDNVVPKAQTLTFKGVALTPTGKDAKHLYQVFSTTIDIRNREVFDK